jgi:hypothetical protein
MRWRRRSRGGAGDDGVARDRHRPAQPVIRRAVGGGQLGPLRAPRGAAGGEGVGRPLVRVGADDVVGGAGDDRVARERHRPAQLVAAAARHLADSGELQLEAERLSTRAEELERTAGELRSLATTFSTTARAIRSEARPTTAEDIVRANPGMKS